MNTLTVIISANGPPYITKQKNVIIIRLKMPLIIQFLHRDDASGNKLSNNEGTLSVPVGIVFERSVSALNSSLSSSLSI